MAKKKPEVVLKPKRGFAVFEGYYIPLTPLKGVLTRGRLEPVHTFNLRQAEANFLISSGWFPVGAKVVRRASSFGDTDQEEMFWRALHIGTPVPQTQAALMARGERRLL